MCLTTTTIENLYHQRNDFFFKGNFAGYTVLIAVFLSSLLGFLYFAGDNPIKAWGGFLLNNLFFYLLSIGGLIFGLIQDACKATWARPIKRFHEVFGVYFFVSSGLFIFFAFAIKYNLWHASYVYHWIAEPSILDHFPGKNSYLKLDFFFYRVVFITLTLVGVMFWVFRQNTLADRAFLRGKLVLASNISWLAAARLRFWSGPILFFTGILFTFLMIDITMSLAPLWFSTLWAGWLFAALMQIFLATIVIFLFLLKNKPMGKLISKAQFHDLGKFLLGFTCFFGYLTYAHVLTYWYGNIPEETEYFLHRLHDPWQQIIVFIGIFSFLVPLIALVPKPAKWTWYVTIPICLLIILSQWLVQIIVVLPQLIGGPNQLTQNTYTLSFGSFASEFFGFLAFTSSFTLVIYLYGSFRPMVSLHDPLLIKYLNDKDH